MNTPQEDKDLVRRLVDEFINGGDIDAIDEFFVPDLAGRIKRLFGSFRSPSLTGTRTSWSWSPRGTR